MSISIKIGFDIRYNATTIALERTNPWKWAGVLVNERPIPPWWNLRRRWDHRQYRKMVTHMLAKTVGIDDDIVDRALQTALKDWKVSLA